VLFSTIATISAGSLTHHLFRLFLCSKRLLFLLSGSPLRSVYPFYGYFQALSSTMAVTEIAPGVNEAKNTNGTTKSLASEGSLPSYKSLYQGPKDAEKKFTWLKDEPEDVAEAAENAGTYSLARSPQHIMHDISSMRGLTQTLHNI
jgi:hypothetical protein